jgi:hypothetical protein
MKRKSKLMIAIAMAVLAVLGSGGACAQDKYSLKSPGRNRILRLQGIRRVVSGLFFPDRRKA